MKSTRILVPSVILMSIVMVVSILSCGGGSSAAMEGTWTLTTIQDNPYPPVGDGTYTITLTGSTPQLEIDYYSGDGVIGGVNYKVNISRKYETDSDGNDYYLFLYQDGQSLNDDSIKFYGRMNNLTSASGRYESKGANASYGTGIFSTMKQ
jgi:hypothetical protein